MKRTLLAIVAAFALAGCSSSPETAKKETPPPAPAPAPAPKPKDETARFPLANRVSVTVTETPVLGKAMLAPGNVAEYRRGPVSYRLFLVKAKSSEAAAVMLFDLKSAMGAPQFKPSFGGYYGVHGAQPLFAFQKGTWVAGVEGLPDKDADPIAREFAARLN